MGIAIRSATLADAEPVARLMTELGYPTSSRKMERRLTSVLGDVLLVQAVESHFLERGAAVSIVTSASRRADAHAFYGTHGYTFDGRRYKKALRQYQSEAT
jgi:hypothetical protein